MHVIDDVVAKGEIEYLHQLKYSMSSMYQHRHGTCVLVAAGKWTCDSGVLET